jgi:hypothetical protein
MGIGLNMSSINSPIGRAISLGLICAIVGSTTGVAAFGDAVNGAIVFGPIGFIVGWFLPSSTKPSDRIDDTETGLVGAVEASSLKDELQNAETSINRIFETVTRLFASIWNVQMKVLIALNLMGYFKDYPWLFVCLAVVLLVLILPLGVIFSVSGMVAMHYNVKGQDGFLIKLNTDT